MNEVLLSICIPTYNRSIYLEKTLLSIVSQEVFINTNSVEIIVSDNASNDNTRQVILRLIEIYGKKIRYFRNDINDQDKNFYDVLLQANGIYAKLCNDTLEFLPGTLEFILNLVRSEQKKKNILFFLNKSSDKNIYCKNIDDFVKHVSYMTTWIGSFGIWKDDKKFLTIMRDYANTRLPHTATVFSMVKERSALVVEKKLFNSLRPSLSGNYNISQIFIVNYLDILKNYRKIGLTDKVYNQERYKVLKKHVIKRQFNYKENYVYDKRNFWKNTKVFHREIRFYIILCIFFIKLFKFRLKVLYYKLFNDKN